MAIRGAILAAVGATPAFAQEDSQAVEASSIDEGTIEQVTVTGSRIARPNAVSPTPVTSLTAEDISLSGETNLGDFLNELPALRSTFSGQNSGRFIGTVGLNLLDLRGLGTSRTLVLQDGRRHIASSVGTSAVDVNTIPEDLIERVDVITGGASAIYGADAVSGVVNFVMKDDFEGLKISAFGSDTENGGAETTETSITFGQNLFDGRANIAGSFSHTSRGDVYGTDREWIAKGYGTLYNPEDTGPEDGIPDRIVVENYTAPILSEQGVLWAMDPATGGLAGYMAQTWDPDGSFRDQQYGDYCDSRLRCDGGDGYRWIGENQMYPSMETNNLFVKGHFDLNDSTRLFAEGKFVTHEAESWGQASFGATPFKSTNPFLSEEAAASAAQLESWGYLPATYRMHTDLGYRGDLTERETQRYVVGVKGDIGSRWNYEASVVYGEYNADIYYVNNRHEERFFQAVDAIQLESGEIVCADEEARAAGCQPLNIFGSGLNSQEAIDWVMLDDTGSEEKMTQTVASGFIGGDVIDLPAGPLSVVGGFEYREETSAVDFDDIIKNGDTFMNALASTKGEYDVTEAYVELSAPLLSDLPGVQSLVFDTAYRAADYSTIGSTGAWKAGLDWTIVDDVRVRATASQAVRAPNIDELFAPLGQNFFSIADPCHPTEIAYAPNPEQRAANCAALGVGDNATFPYNAGPTLPGFSGGNVNLQEETAVTQTVGLVVTPRFAEGLTITADYWDIEIEDAISYYGGQTILDKCVDASSINNQFCGNIERDANGDLVSLTSSALNASKLTAKGIDYEVRYEMALADLFKSELGSLTLSLQGTHLLERDDYSFQNEPDSVDRIDGELGDPTNAYNMNVTYRYGDLSVNWSHRYLDDMALYDLGLSQPESAAPSNTGEVRYNDLRASYLFQDSIEVYGGINNIEDQEPPAYLSGIGGGSGMYDTLGRSFYLGANYTF